MTLRELAPRSCGDDVYATALGRERLAAIVDDIRELPIRQKDALLLASIDGLPHAEIAQRLNTTIPATKSLLKRARATLTRMRDARATLADRSRGVVAALLAPAGKLTASAAPAVVLSVAAIGGPAVLFGVGQIVTHDTVTPTEPAPRSLLYGPFQIKQGTPVPDGMRLEEATVELPGGEAVPSKRRLSITCPPGYVHAGVSTKEYPPQIARMWLSGASAARIGLARTAIIAFRPKPNVPGPYTLKVGIECDTPARWRAVGEGYGLWAECTAIRKYVRRLRRDGDKVPAGLLRARRIDCREWRAFAHR